MAEQTTGTREEVVNTPTGVVRETTTTANVPGRSAALGERIVGLITGLLLSLLAIRMVLSLLGANRSNGFADFIYGLTYPFVAPFFGLFGYTVQYGVSRFETETLVAIVIYALVGFGISKLFSLGRVR